MHELNKVGVIGLGYVALPIATIFAEAGIELIGFYINKKIYNTLNIGESHI